MRYACGGSKSDHALKGEMSMFGLMTSLIALPNFHLAVVHGHWDTGEPGADGLMVDREGFTRVVRVTVTPVGDK